MYGTLLAMASTRCPMCGLLIGCRCDNHGAYALVAPSDVEWEQMEIEKSEEDRRQFPPVADPTADRYPSLAERLAASIRADR